MRGYFGVYKAGGEGRNGEMWIDLFWRLSGRVTDELHMKCEENGEIQSGFWDL